MAVAPTLTLRPSDHSNAWLWDPTVNRFVTSKRLADDHAYPIDMVDAIDEGDTLASVVAVNVHGLTVNAITVSGTTLTVDVTQAGHLVAQVTTTNGDIKEVPLEWRTIDRRDLRVYV